MSWIILLVFCDVFIHHSLLKETFVEGKTDNGCNQTGVIICHLLLVSAIYPFSFSFL
jgi:hypothetical protein